MLTIRNKQKIDRKTVFGPPKKIRPKKNCSEKTFMSEIFFFNQKPRKMTLYEPEKTFIKKRFPQKRF